MPLKNQGIGKPAIGDWGFGQSCVILRCDRGQLPAWFLPLPYQSQSLVPVNNMAEKAFQFSTSTHTHTHTHHRSGLNPSPTNLSHTDCFPPWGTQHEVWKGTLQGADYIQLLVAPEDTSA